MNPFDVSEIRKDFPILQTKIYGKDLIYFDNGATAQKPQRVIDRMQAYYETENSNVHRGVHYLSDKATNAYEASRKTIQNFIKAESSDEIIFTKGTTDSINTLAFSLGEGLISGDEILISGMEHHSNIVPWQMLCERKGCLLKIMPLLPDGSLDLEALPKQFNERTKIVSISHVSNAMGIINPIDHIIELAHAKNAMVIVDAAQSIQHQKIDVQQINCDFLMFSGHKLFGPTGIGILYGKKALLDVMPPYQGGGDMIEKVSFEKTTYNVTPLKFEAGTPNIVGAIGLAEAIAYLESIDLVGAFAHEHRIGEYLRTELAKIPELRFYGTASKRYSTSSFLVGDLHPFDVGTLLDKQGIAVRTGHHCTQPLMQFFNIPGTVRASLAFYNTEDEIDVFIIALQRSIQMLS